MAAGINQKLKMLYLVRILSEETDENHGLSAQEIISKLEAHEVNADRKTLYKDFDELDRYGMEVLSERVGRNVLYHLSTRSFELPELKLLVDAVQSAKFITEKKSRDLISGSWRVSPVSMRQNICIVRCLSQAGLKRKMNRFIMLWICSMKQSIPADRSGSIIPGGQ